MQLKRLPRTTAVGSLIARLEPLMYEHRYFLNDAIQATSTEDPAAVWEKEVDFGRAFIAILIIELKVPGARRNVARVQYGFKDSALAPICDDGEEEVLRFVGQFGASMENAKGSRPRTALQRNRLGLEAGLYDVSTYDAIDESFELLVADLRDIALTTLGKFPTRRSIYEHLADCRRLDVPAAFQDVGDKYLMLEAMYGDKARALRNMHARLASVFRWRRFYQLIGLDKTRTQPREASRLERMIAFVSSEPLDYRS
jgi:hypothetical protein